MCRGRPWVQAFLDGSGLSAEGMTLGEAIDGYKAMLAASPFKAP